MPGYEGIDYILIMPDYDSHGDDLFFFDEITQQWQVKTESPLYQRILEDIQKYPPGTAIYICIGSLRQDFQCDIFNRNNNQNGLCFDNFPLLTRTLQDKFPARHIRFYSGTITDEQFNLDVGYEHRNRQYTHTPDEDKFSYVWNLMAQAHGQHVRFSDDKMSILSALQRVFQGPLRRIFNGTIFLTHYDSAENREPRPIDTCQGHLSKPISERSRRAFLQYYADNRNFQKRIYRLDLPLAYALACLFADTTLEVTQDHLQRLEGDRTFCRYVAAQHLLAPEMPFSRMYMEAADFQHRERLSYIANALCEMAESQAPEPLESSFCELLNTKLADRQFQLTVGLLSASNVTINATFLEKMCNDGNFFEKLKNHVPSSDFSAISHKFTYAEICFDSALLLKIVEEEGFESKLSAIFEDQQFLDIQQFCQEKYIRITPKLLIKFVEEPDFLKQTHSIIKSHEFTALLKFLTDCGSKINPALFCKIIMDEAFRLKVFTAANSPQCQTIAEQYKKYHIRMSSAQLFNVLDNENYRFAVYDTIQKNYFEPAAQRLKQAGIPIDGFLLELMLSAVDKQQVCGIINSLPEVLMKVIKDNVLFQPDRTDLIIKIIRHKPFRDHIIAAGNYLDWLKKRKWYAHNSHNTDDVKSYLRVIFNAPVHFENETKAFLTGGKKRGTREKYKTSTLKKEHSRHHFFETLYPNMRENSGSLKKFFHKKSWKGFSRAHLMVAGLTLLTVLALGAYITAAVFTGTGSIWGSIAAGMIFGGSVSLDITAIVAAGLTFLGLGFLASRLSTTEIELGDVTPTAAPATAEVAEAGAAAPQDADIVVTELGPRPQGTTHTLAHGQFNEPPDDRMGAEGPVGRAFTNVAPGTGPNSSSPLADAVAREAQGSPTFN